MKYQVVLEESEEGFAASVPSLPGCHSQGATEPEALENIADAIREYLASSGGRGKAQRAPDSTPIVPGHAASCPGHPMMRDVVA
jgi:predicted RNase H-like HicB family nuclease